MAGKAGAAMALAAVIVGQRHAEMQLDVGHVEVGPGFQEAAAFGKIRGHRPAAFAPVLADRPQQPRQRFQRDAVEVRIVGHVAEHEIGMVLQILSDAGQMMHAVDAVLDQRCAVADAGQHQQLRGLERAGGHDHLAPGAELLQFLALAVFDADRALAFEQDAGGMRAGLDAQIGAAAHMGVDIGARRTPAFAVFLRHLVDAEAFMVVGIEILAQAELRFLRGLQESLLHGISGAQFVDGERAALAVIFAVEIGIVFRALEIGQHVGERPAGIAERGPLVVIAAVAADIDHGVDRGRAAEPLAARLIADAAVEALLRHGVEGPVVDVAGDHQHQRERRRHHPIVVLAAGIQQRHRGLRILGNRPATVQPPEPPPTTTKSNVSVTPVPPVFCLAAWLRFWQTPLFGRLMARPVPRGRFVTDLGVTKTSKTGPWAFPKQRCVDTYRSHPRALPGLPSQEASGRDRSAPKSVGRFRFGSGFSKGKATV